ncbi:MAG: hypothetical protein ACTSR0_04150 [Candidatus Asgardarchaeia archaeon]
MNKEIREVAKEVIELAGKIEKKLEKLRLEVRRDDTLRHIVENNAVRARMIRLEMRDLIELLY